jgi:hypothetical protein
MTMWNPDDLGKLVWMVAETREEEIGCDECFEQLDRFVEMRLSGLDAVAAMPLVQDHLEKCGDCHEEFEMLLEALRASERASGAWEPIWRLWIRVRRALGSS